MSVRRVVPDIRSDCISDSQRFYTELLGLRVGMDMGWVVTLVSPSHPTAQLTLFRSDETASEQPQITIEVNDIDDIYQKAVKRGARIVYPLTIEPWGVKRFFVADSNGIILNVMCHLGNVTTS